MARELTQAAQGAKQIRQWLKAQGIAASVTSDNYSMGSSINVYVENLNPEQYKMVDAFADQYQYGDFDGMQDLYEYRKDRPELPQAKYVFVNNKADELLRQKIWNFALGYYNGLENAPADADQAGRYRIENFNMYGDQMIWQLFNGANPAYWAFVAQQQAEAA